ncbi:rhomboid family intramembrane serine protease [Modicisalibacter luteus]|jgi:GlpG protein|uniref:Rhomboid family intramembrane serine protease n=1 Tax=Modicisalibacter luteus TaxID=453962 RepID=A0ABV7LYZ1_9GAMM|nr:rhomboid family intramembrane serine protease [Halomonas lutea]GHA95900.1 rhomboid family intramembrane serine protease [Halomonas lutea]
MYKVLEMPRDIDTRALRKALWAERIGHRFTEEGNVQVLWLADPKQHQELLQLLTRWERGEPLQISDGKRRTRRNWRQSPLAEAPVAIMLIGLCLAVFAIMAILGDLVIAAMTITPLGVVGNTLSVGTLGDTLASGQIWRLVSPAFLHFGWMHLIFNMLWLWYFGRQIEALQGSWRLLGIVMLSALASNLAQYATGTVLFGGMSGVDYALLGYVWLMSRRAPRSGFFVPQMLVVFMLGWMVFTMTDFAEPIGFGNVANEAHLGGLLVGLLTGWIASSRARKY